MSELVEKVAREIGEHYDGCADPTVNPNNYARAKEAAIIALAAIRETHAIVPRVLTDEAWLSTRDVLMMSTGYIGRDDFSAAYTAMIAAAEKE